MRAGIFSPSDIDIINILFCDRAASFTLVSLLLWMFFVKILCTVIRLVSVTDLEMQDCAVDSCVKLYDGVHDADT